MRRQEQLSWYGRAEVTLWQLSENFSASIPLLRLLLIFLKVCSGSYEALAEVHTVIGMHDGHLDLLRMSSASDDYSSATHHASSVNPDNVCQVIDNVDGIEDAERRRKEREASERRQARERALERALDVLKQDYANMYFITGHVSEQLYHPQCRFSDPTLQFRGFRKYRNNLKFLKCFFETGSIECKHMYLVDSVDGDEERTDANILAQWRLRVRVRLPWRPLIDVTGQTNYQLTFFEVGEGELEARVMDHAESWEGGPLPALKQLIRPGPNIDPS